MPIAANWQAQFRMIDYRVREEAPERSHHDKMRAITAISLAERIANEGV